MINKSEIIKRGYVESTKLERSILCEADHPYVVHLRYAFQNGQKLYLVTGRPRNCTWPRTIRVSQGAYSRNGIKPLGPTRLTLMCLALVCLQTSTTVGTCWCT